MELFTNLKIRKREVSKKINKKIAELTKKVDDAVISFKEYLVEKEKEIYAKIAGYFTKHGHDAHDESASKVMHSEEPTTLPSIVKSKPQAKPQKSVQKKTVIAKKAATKSKAVVNAATTASAELDNPTKSLEAMGNVAKDMARIPIVKKSPVKKNTTVKAVSTTKSSKAVQKQPAELDKSVKSPEAMDNVAGNTIVSKPGKKLPAKKSTATTTTKPGKVSTVKK